MNNDHYRLMLANAPYAYALHKIMLDGDGKPIDYQYIEANKAFSQLTGLPSNIVGKTVTELLPGIRSGSFDWVEYYGKIALDGGHETFEQYSEPLKKWYKVHVQSSENRIFSTIFTDITHEKELKSYQKRLTLAQSLTNSGTWEYDIQKQKDNEIILEREENLRQIVNNIDGAFWLMSADKQEILYLSPSFEIIFGRPVESLRGNFEAYIEVIHEEDRENGIKAYVDFQKTGKYAQEYRIRRPDGSIRWVHSKAFPVKNEQGNVIRYAGIITDITDRKRMERETLEAKRLAEANQQRFADIAEYTGEFVWEVDKTGIYTYTNSAVELMLGYKPEELAGKISYYDLLSDNYKTKTIEEVSKIIENKEPIRNIENVMISKSGKEVHVITNGIPVLDADGELIGYRGSDRDITERKQAEEALKKSEEKYKRLSYNLHAGIVVHDANTNIIFSNKEASNLLGLSAEQLNGRDAEHSEWYFLNEHGEKLLKNEYPVNIVFSKINRSRTKHSPSPTPKRTILNGYW